MDNIIFNIYLYLPLKEIYRCMQVNKQFYKQSKEPYLWLKLLESEFGYCYKEFKQDTLYETYQICNELREMTLSSRAPSSNISELCDSLQIELYDPTVIMPKAIGQFRRLYTLRINSKNLTMISSEITRLKYLKEIELCNNKLTTIPPEIGKLISLRKLNLTGNQLISVPKEIGELFNLEELYLSKNQLLLVPKEMCNLTNLRVLYLDRNKLIYIPDEMSKLTNLYIFYLGHNKLTSVPEGVKQLKIRHCDFYTIASYEMVVYIKS